MRHFLLTTVLVLLADSALSAQERNKPLDPRALVVHWYRQFLDRDPDPGMVVFVAALRQGTRPQEVLAGLLESPEYLQNAGGTIQGFIRELFDDILGREPTPKEQLQWVTLAQMQPRRAVALLFLKTYPGGWMPDGEGQNSDWLADLRQASVRLGMDLRGLQESVVTQLEGVRARELYRLTDTVLADLRAFAHLFRPGVTRERLLRVYQLLDTRLDSLADAVRLAAGNNLAIEWALARVQQADFQIELILQGWYENNRFDPRIVLRQTIALVQAGKQLQRLAAFVVPKDFAGKRFDRELAELISQAEIFGRQVKEAKNLQQLLRPFTAVTKEWSDVVTAINALPPRSGYYQLRLQSQRLNDVYLVLHRQLALRSVPPQVAVRLDGLDVAPK